MSRQLFTLICSLGPSVHNFYFVFCNFQWGGPSTTPPKKMCREGPRKHINANTWTTCKVFSTRNFFTPPLLLATDAFILNKIYLTSVCLKLPLPSARPMCHSTTIPEAVRRAMCEYVKFTHPAFGSPATSPELSAHSWVNSERHLVTCFLWSRKNLTIREMWKNTVKATSNKTWVPRLQAAISLFQKVLHSLNFHYNYYTM
jgi:hypothetical protein